MELEGVCVPGDGVPGKGIRISRLRKWFLSQDHWRAESETCS